MRGGRRPTWRPEREARGSALGVQSREGSCVFAVAFLLSNRVLRDSHVASLLGMTRQGGPAVGTVHCIEFAVLLPLRGRARLSAPLQWRVRSAILPGNLQLPMALATRKGHAASVRRQSRQRLRSERRYIFLSRSRRYRRNRSVRFYRHLERTGSAFPRLPRRFAPRNDKSGDILILTVTCTNRQQCAGRGTPRLRDFHSIIIISHRPASASGSPCPDSSAAESHQSACPPAPWPLRRIDSGRRGGRSRAS